MIRQKVSHCILRFALCGGGGGLEDLIKPSSVPVTIDYSRHRETQPRLIQVRGDGRGCDCDCGICCGRQHGILSGAFLLIYHIARRLHGFLDRSPYLVTKVRELREAAVAATYRASMADDGDDDKGKARRAAGWSGLSVAEGCHLPLHENNDNNQKEEGGF